jgi:hypothetical protein
MAPGNLDIHVGDSSVLSFADVMRASWLPFFPPRARQPEALLKVPVGDVWPVVKTR